MECAIYTRRHHLPTPHTITHRNAHRTPNAGRLINVSGVLFCDGMTRFLN